MQEDNLALRSLKTSGWGTVLIAALFIGYARFDWAIGFVIGAFLSLFSMFSLVVVVPMLCRPGAGRHGKALLSLTLFMKLPLYAIGLYIATHVRGIEVAGAGLGVALVPGVLTLKAIGEALNESLRLPAKQAKTPKTPEEDYYSARSRRSQRAHVAHERG